MSVFKRKNGRWYFRVVVELQDKSRKRLNGTTPSGVPNTKKATEHAERIAIANALNPGSAQWHRKDNGEEQKKATPTIANYIKDYLEVISEDGSPMGRLAKKRHLENDITTEFGHMPLDGIRQIHIDKFKTKLLKGTKPTKKSKKRDPVSIKTVNNILTPLGTLLRYAVANDVISGFKLKLNFPEDESEIESISPEDFTKLLATCSDQRYRVALLLGRNAGLRIGEIRALRWCDVDERNKRITIRAAYDTAQNLKSTKNRRIRKVPLEKMLLSEMKLLMQTDSVEWAGKGTIVTNLKTGEPLSYWATRDAILALYKKASVELPRLPWHCLRHAFCTELADSGVPIHTIKDLAGHSSIETTLRYMHTGEKAKQDAITLAFESSWRKYGANQDRKSEKPSN